MPRVPTARIALYAERAGAGERLLWISGTGGDLRNPPRILESPLAVAFDLVAFDQRGLGRSDKPDETPSMADYADDAAALMDAIGWDRAHIAGYSFGGMVAQHFALRHSTRVNRLVLAATSSGGAGGASYPLHELHDLDGEERIRRQLLLDARMTQARIDAPSPALAQRMEEMRAAQRRQAEDPEGAKGQRLQLEARRRHDVFDRLSGLAMPTMVCAGAFDLLAPPENAEALAARIPGAVLRYYRGGHGFLAEAADFLTDVIAFLNGEALPPRTREQAIAR